MLCYVMKTDLPYWTTTPLIWGQCLRRCSGDKLEADRNSRRGIRHGIIRMIIKAGPSKAGKAYFHRARYWTSSPIAKLAYDNSHGNCLY
jgi:hypothetical protein